MVCAGLLFGGSAMKSKDSSAEKKFALASVVLLKILIIVIIKNMR